MVGNTVKKLLQALKPQAAVDVSSEGDQSHVVFEARKQRFERLGFTVSACFLLGIIGSASVIKISGAVLGAGQVIQSGENKQVQHSVGGPVGNLLVENGDLVSKGDPLLKLDDAQIKAQQIVLSQRRAELQLAVDRLAALQKGETISFQNEKYAQIQTQYPEAVARQSALFDAQRERFIDAQQQLETRIKGLEKEFKAIRRQIWTSRKQLTFLDESIAEITVLFDEGLVSKSRLTNLELERISVMSQVDALNLSKARIENGLTDTRSQLAVMQKENQEALWLEIEATNTEFAETQETLIAMQDAFDRLVVTAPAAGRVHELSIKNVDAVVRPGQVIMQIVPASAGPAVSARVRPVDVDQVFQGQEARVRFDAFDSNTTPEIKGKVAKVSPDTSMDEHTGELYYAVTITLADEELAKVSHLEVIPGLPVSTMLTTSERSILNYVIKPITSRMFLAFRDG